ncbi:unnamed protein product [Rotaria sp. Silwood2]|nr:unnamed protein product [Rotaria sp. Silwood2]CAF4098030.1 unnamed protein product [Rotaria sp. Silwood2]CAF4345053.1 unnamed protein product [Rotaria sp. Silwood2]
MGIIPLIYAQFNSSNPFFSINAFCKTRGYVNQWSAMSCRWLLVMGCVDRCIECSTNANIRRCLTVHMARRIAILVVIIWMVFPIHKLIFSNIILPGNIGCITTNNSVAIYHDIFILIMGGTLPPLIMLICTMFIWKSLKMRNERRVMLRPTGSERQKNTRDQQVLIILLTQVAIYIVSALPFMSNNLYTALTRDVQNKSVDRRAIEGFAQVISELFVYIFPASTFYSNSLVSRTFRKELMAIFKCLILCRNRKQSRIGPINQTRLNDKTNGLNMQTIGKI